MDSVFDDIVVCIPTVRPRARVLAETLAEWRRFDVEPLVQLQPDEWPVGHSQRRNCDDTLSRALREHPKARYILVSEDDILLAPELELWIPALKLLHSPATLYLNGLVHYPPDIQRHCRARRTVPECIVRVQRLGAWYGSLAILMARAIAESTLRWSSELQGWEIHFQTFMLRNRIPLYAAVPNPVQHRGVPTTHRQDAGWEPSASFGLRIDGSAVSPAAGIDWPAIGGWNPAPHHRKKRDSRV